MRLRHSVLFLCLVVFTGDLLPCAGDSISCCMPRARHVIGSPPVCPSSSQISGPVLSNIAEAGFGDARRTAGGGWVARCLACTGPDVLDDLDPHVRKAGVCASVTACKAHQSHVHSRAVRIPVDQGDAAYDAFPTVEPAGSPVRGAPAAEDACDQPIVDPQVASPSSPGVSDAAEGASSAGSEPYAVGLDATPSPSSESAVASCSDADSGLGQDLAPGPRKGSGAWWLSKRLDPVATGSSMSALQVAFNIAELREKGVTKVATSQVGKLMLNLLRSFSDPGNELRNVHIPSSTHLVEQVLGVRQAREFEFGWCPTCGYRYPPAPVRSGTLRERRAQMLSETCPNCGTNTYKVSTVSLFRCPRPCPPHAARHTRIFTAGCLHRQHCVFYRCLASWWLCR